ncbi:MAG: DUF2752 domain-containing protein [Acidobacteriia bacterium]|nr:DUF2752 domain-containing protein [Terriglobia bacterium]
MTPHRIHRDRAGAVWQVAVAGLALLSLRFYAVPLQPKFTVCGFHWLTGRPCPLCGMTRALSQLAKGHGIAAIHFNALGPLVFVVLGAALVGGILQLAGWDFWDRVIPASGRKKFWSGCVVLFLGYGLLRFFQIVP